MNIFKKAAGKVLYGIASFISIILEILITITDIIVTFVANIAKGFALLIGMGGCLFLFMLTGPFGIMMLMNPVILLSILFFVIFPILGTKFVSFLKYLKYIITEFLFDRANYLINGTSYQFKSFDEYKNKYKRMEEDRRRKEQQRRQAEQQKEWEERFRQWNQYQNSQRRSSGYGWYNQNNGYGNGQTHMDPTGEFKKKYEKSCDLLGVGYDADKYQIKLAYRKKAKQYHPDLNKSPDATKMFQKINSAYEFLGDENIARYKSIS